MKIFVVLAIFSYVNFCTSDDYYEPYEDYEEAEGLLEEILCTQ